MIKKMNEFNSNLITQIATDFIEFALQTEVDWEIVYLNIRLAKGYSGISMAYTKDNRLSFLNGPDDDEDELEEKVIPACSTLFEGLEKDYGKPPLVCVFRINKTYDFSTKFDYEDVANLSIQIIDIGTKQSYFSYYDKETTK